MPDEPNGTTEQAALSPPVPHSATIRYIPGLDGLRGLAVLAVLLHHSGVPGFRGGFVGVDVFFILSGFLITRILLRRIEKENRVPFRHFYERRARRILPALWAYFALTTVVALVDPAFSPPDEYMHSLAIAAVFLTQWQVAMWDLPGPFVHLWSLGWEENFYIVWPLLFALFGRRSKRALSLLLSGGIVYLSFVRYADFWIGYKGPWGLWVASYFRVDTIMLGCLLGLLVAYEPDQRSGPWLRREPWIGIGALVLLVLTFTVSHDEFFFGGGYTLVAVLTLVMVNHLRRRTASPLARILETPVLRWVGLISYSLYLWHYTVFHLLRTHGLEWKAIFLVGTPVSIGLAALSYYTVEAWFRKA